MKEPVKPKFRYEEKVEWVEDGQKRTGVIVEWMYNERSLEVTYLVRADDNNKIKYVAVKEERLSKVVKEN